MKTETNNQETENFHQAVQLMRRTNTTFSIFFSLIIFSQESG